MNGNQLMLNVPFSQKNRASALGARLSSERRSWYVPHGVDINLFQRWWPRELKAQMKALGQNIPR